MSYTEMFKFKKDGSAEGLAEVNNAWRGAMAVWTILEKKYLPPYIPEWAKTIPNYIEGKTFSRTSGSEEIDKIWGMAKLDNITETDRIVLNTTFDDVIVERANIQKVIDAFNDFEGESSMKEQAVILTEALRDEDLIAVGWNQTSVVGDTWTNTGDYQEEEDEYLPYNILTGDKHWELFEDKKD